MALFCDSDRSFAESVSHLAFCNPFLPERIAHERDALGRDFVEIRRVWTVNLATAEDHVNVQRLRAALKPRLDAWRQAMVDGEEPSREDRQLYADVVLYYLYDAHREDLLALFEPEDAPRKNGGAGSSGKDGGNGKDSGGGSARRLFEGFHAMACHYLDALPGHVQSQAESAHLLALCYQVRRAFYYTFRFIAGASMPAARLRADIWRSIFTHDMRRYKRALYRSLGTMPTLIGGPSGTGKELVARAIGLSLYLPYDVRAGEFDANLADRIHAVNLAALSPTLLESELFGHCRGAFTGAVQDHVGWLETCGPGGAVFLDEIGEVSPAIQVKLLRVLHSRTFQRLGETTPRRFAGKLIAATNRDLAAEIAAGTFREDLYYRLCGDIITTPSLQAQLADAPDQLADLVHFIVHGLVPAEEVADLTAEVTAWITANLGPDYPWSGNFRELEQCVRNILIRQVYQPAFPRADASATEDPLTAAVLAGEADMATVERWYIARVHGRIGTLSGAARQLGLDRRTVKDRLGEPPDDA